MINYYLALAWRSLLNSLVLTGLMILAVGVGIGSSMTMLTIFRAANADPIPGKSKRLFLPQIENFGPISNQPPQDKYLTKRLTYIDAMGLMQGSTKQREAVMYPITVAITPSNPTEAPIQAEARATSVDFFSMFDVPFRFGGPWSKADDDSGAPFVILGKPLNDRLFYGADSVGRTVTINEAPYRVMGVLRQWAPRPRFYDLGDNTYSDRDDLFIPFRRAINQQMPTSGNFACDRAGPGKGWDGILRANCIWLNYWVELPTAKSRRDYLAYLRNYAAVQQRSGRFHWSPLVALRDVRALLIFSDVMPTSVSTLTPVGFAILLVCLLNAMGLMLTKFMAMTTELRIRRTLGARRIDIFGQCLAEAGAVGVLGGVLGLAFMGVGLNGARLVMPTDLSTLTRAHVTDVVISLAVAIVATLLTGIFPAWRASQLQGSFSKFQ